MSSDVSTENQQHPRMIDLRKADSAYTPFPSFSEWLAKSSVDTVRWERYTNELQERRDTTPQLLPRALEIVKRAAAVDTGAIEGLYETDRGFTFTIATQAAFWEAALDKKGPKVRAFFESHLQAYDSVLDFATQAVPMAEAWIRNLHAEICKSQDTYRVWTELGWQEQSLPKGEYKHLPNHVIQADGEVHAYAPVDMTPTEMYRLCEEVRSEAFLAAHPALQAAYAHYALVVIHPFADGNGRVARALASVFTYRAQSVPLLILVDNRKDYLESLIAADAGDFQAFVDFILERTLDAIQLANESLKAAAVPSIEEGIEQIRNLQITQSGYTQVEVDDAGFKLFELVKKEIKIQENRIATQRVVNIRLRTGTHSYAPINSAYRLPARSGEQWMDIRFVVSSPSPAHTSRTFGLEVPIDCGREDDIIIRNLDTQEIFGAHITDLIPEISNALRMRISIWVEKVLGKALVDLYALAKEGLKTFDS